MTPIQTNKPVFFGDEGNVLEGGRIYIGQPATDPRTNPKTVTFRDSGGSEFTAQQPLKTIAGRISYNGKPIVALVDGDYSMLILDSSGKQIDYSRDIQEQSGGGGIADFSEVTRVGLTLDEIKAFDSSVGDTIRNVGKVSATDGLGASWLVTSATGSPGDDETLIDLDNGLQAELFAVDSEFNRRVVVDLGGDFSAGDPGRVVISRSGYIVSIRSLLPELSHTSGASASSDSVIPSWALPQTGTTGEWRNFFGYDGLGTSSIARADISNTLNRLEIRYYDANLAPTSESGVRGLTITYPV